MPPSLEDAADMGKEKAMTCRAKIGMPFKVVGHIGATSCCVMLGYKGILGFITFTPSTWLLSLMAVVSCIVMFGIECSGFLEWLSGRVDCCKPVVKFYPQSMRENLQRHLIRGTIYVLIGTAGLIGNHYAKDGGYLFQFFGTLVFGVFFLLAECVEEEVDKPMNASKYDELEKKSKHVASAADVALP